MQFPKAWFQWLALVLALFGAAGSMWGQSISNDETMTTSTSAPEPLLPLPVDTNGGEGAAMVVPAAPDTYKIGRRDLLSVYVFQMPEFSSQVRVDDSGEIALPLLHERIPVAGLTTPEVSQILAEHLETAGLARNPRIQVVVRQVASRTIVITGEVRNPGTIQAVRPLTLSELLSRAGGTTERASSQVEITEPGSPAHPAGRHYVFDLSASSGTHAVQPVFSGGETVNVMPVEMVYAVGALKQPGAFPIHSGQPLTVMRAIALAQGFAPHPDRKHAMILTSTGPDHKQITAVPIDLDQILKGRKVDPILQPGQMVFIPEDVRGKGLGVALSDVGQALTLAIAYGKF